MAQTSFTAGSTSRRWRSSARTRLHLPPFHCWGLVRARSFSHPWISFASLSLIFFLVSAGTFSSLGVVLPAMVREMHWTWAEAGMGYTILGIACGLASFVPAILIRSIGVRGTLMIGTAMLVAGFGAMAVAHSVWVYLLATLLIGVAFSLTCTVPGTHVLTGLFQKRSTVLGAYFTVGALGGVAGPILYVAIQALTHGWRVYWVVFVIASALLGTFAIVSTPGRIDLKLRGRGPARADRPAGDDRGPARLDRAPRPGHAAVLCIVGAYTMYLLINTTAHGFAVEQLTERGIDAKAAAGMLSLEALIGAVVSVIGGVVGEKVAPKTLLLIALVALTIGMAALAEARGYGLMLVYAIGVGIGYGLSFVAPTMMLFNYFGKKANLELYSIMCLISTSAALGPAFGGWARDATGQLHRHVPALHRRHLRHADRHLFITPPVFEAERRALPLSGELPMSDRPIDAELLISGATIITMNAARHVIEDGALAIKGDRIVAVGKREALARTVAAKETIDGRRFVITPGFVDGHIHITGDPLTRGFARGAPEDSWSDKLQRWVIPIFRAQTADEERIAAQCAALAMMRSGTTCFLEAGTVLQLDAVMDGLAETGVRGRVGEWVEGRAFDPSADQAKLSAEAIAILESEIARYPDKDDAKLAAWPVLVGHSTNSDDVWRAAKALADEHGLGVSAHMSPRIGDSEWFLAKYGRRPLEHLADIGVLGPNVCDHPSGHIDRSELDILARPGPARSIARTRRSRAASACRRSGSIRKCSTRASTSCSAPTACRPTSSRPHG